MIKKILLSTAVLGTFAAYAVHLRFDDEEHPVVAMRTPIETVPVNTPSPFSAASNGPVPAVTPNPTATPRGRYKDGSYAGSVADAFYGNVQVKAVISGGKITDVQFLQYPNDRQTSIEINSQAMPFLRQEAIQVQSARVDGVSGATQTSHAFIESLRSALNQAI